MLQPVIKRLYSHLTQHGLAPPSTRHSHITLIYKGRGDRDDTSSYRPISLLNCDYKILAKLLARKMGRALHKLVGPEQHGFVPCRQLPHAVQTLQLAIEHARLTRHPLLAFMCDFMKAYDTLDRGFLLQSLHRLGIPPAVITAFRALHTNTMSQVTYDSLLSAPFNVHSGVRQGCPWAPSLFILALESLMYRVRTSPELQGYHLPAHSGLPSLDLRQNAYADDLTFTTDHERSLHRFVGVAAQFARASGLHLHLNKCVLGTYNVPAAQRTSIAEHIGCGSVDLAFSSFTYLGVPVGNEDVSPFWDSRLLSYLARLRHLASLGLSVFGRCQCAAAYALSTLWHALSLSHLPINGDVLQRVTSAYRNFGLNGKPVVHPRPGSECYRMNVFEAALHRKYGGVGLVNVPAYLRVRRFHSGLGVLRRRGSPAHVLLTHIVHTLTSPWGVDSAVALLHRDDRLERMLRASPLIMSWREYLRFNQPRFELLGACPHAFVRASAFFHPRTPPSLWDAFSEASWRRVAEAGLAGIAALRTPLGFLPLPEWQQRLPRVHQREEKWEALREACPIPPLDAGHEPDACCHSCALAPWQWGDQARKQKADTVTIKQLYDMLVEPRATHTVPLFVHKWGPLLRQDLRETPRTVFKSLWLHRRVPMQILDMVYAVLNDALPTRCRALRDPRARCPVCGEGLDSIPHILFECPQVASLWQWAHAAWAAWQAPDTAGRPPRMTLALWLNWVLDCLTNNRPVAPYLYWSVPVLQVAWLARNEAAFQHAYPTPARLRRECLRWWCQFANEGMYLMQQPGPFFHPLFAIADADKELRWRGPPDPP